MTPFENIFVGTFMFLIFLGLIAMLLAIIKYAILYPLSSYYTKKGTNKLQWKANESPVSREYRINGNTDSSLINQFYLEWRILPSELPYIIRIYGFNDWEKFTQTKYLHFENEQEFKDFVGKLKTLKDLREYYNKINDKIIWYEP
jgi:hypothetical protein